MARENQISLCQATLVPAELSACHAELVENNPEAKRAHLTTSCLATSEIIEAGMALECSHMAKPMSHLE